MEISISAIKNSMSTFLERYHFLLFFVFLISSASYSILLINETVAQSDNPNGYTSSASSSNFDEDTITRLRALKDDEQATEKLPVTGRVSPF